MRKGEKKEKQLARDWAFVFESKLNGGLRAEELFTWKLRMEDSVNLLKASLENPSSITTDAKVKALTEIINLRRQERQLLRDYLTGRKHLIYLSAIRRNRNQSRSIARGGHRKTSND